MDRFLTADDKREMQAALITRFRSGEIDPIEFRRLMQAAGAEAAEITWLRNLYVDECAQYRKELFK